MSAPTAERLVRARYSAYAVGDAAFVVRTWHPRHRPDVVDVDDGTEWTGLVVEEVVAGREADDEGTVTFRARWRRGAHQGEMRERSRVVRRGGRWCYLDGDAL
jgi:SEC-C motif-containing protein